MPPSGPFSGKNSKTAPRGLVDSARQSASHFAGEVKEHASGLVNEQKNAAASGLTSLASAVRRMGDDLRHQGHSEPVPQFAAEFGETVASRIEDAANYLHAHNLEDVVQEVETFARRKPTYFFAGAVALGFLGARILRSRRPAPAFLRNLPDPNRALPPSSRF